jgi:hypothetical protein
MPQWRGEAQRTSSCDECGIDIERRGRIPLPLIRDILHEE